SYGHALDWVKEQRRLQQSPAKMGVFNDNSITINSELDRTLSVDTIRGDQQRGAVDLPEALIPDLIETVVDNVVIDEDPAANVVEPEPPKKAPARCRTCGELLGNLGHPRGKRPLKGDDAKPQTGGLDEERVQRATKKLEELGMDEQSYRSSREKQQGRVACSSVVGRVSIVRRQRLHPVKTGGGPPDEEQESFDEEWLSSIQDLIDKNTRFTGLGQNLEAGIKPGDPIARAYGFNELTRMSRSTGRINKCRRGVSSDGGKYSITAVVMRSIASAFDEAASFEAGSIVYSITSSMATLLPLREGVLSPQERYDIVLAFLSWEKQAKDSKDSKRYTLKAFGEAVLVMRENRDIPLALRDSFTVCQICNYIRNWKQRGRPSPEDVRAAAEKELRKSMASVTTLSRRSTTSASNDDAEGPAETSTEGDIPDGTNSLISPPSTLLDRLIPSISPSTVPEATMSGTKRSYSECISSLCDAAEAAKGYYSLMHKKVSGEPVNKAVQTDTLLFVEVGTIEEASEQESAIVNSTTASSEDADPLQGVSDKELRNRYRFSAAALRELLGILQLREKRCSQEYVSRSVEEVIDAIVLNRHRFIEFPGDSQILRGDADDVVPLADRADFIDSKRHISLNVQAVLGSNNLWTSVNSSNVGSAHDSRVYQSSLLSRRMRGVPPGHWLCGDSAYGLAPSMFTPYADPLPHTPEAAFNLAHKSVRSAIERKFRSLKRSWAICNGNLRLRPPEKSARAVLACFCLHNFQTLKGEFDEIEDNEGEALEEFEEGEIEPAAEG
ncbi:hypothetical protein FOL47_001609, partial [Perkinsus chesapeaki]